MQDFLLGYTLTYKYTGQISSQSFPIRLVRANDLKEAEEKLRTALNKVYNTTDPEAYGIEVCNCTIE